MTTPITLTPDQVRAALDGRLAEIRIPIAKLSRFGKITEFGKSTTEGYDWHFRDKYMSWNDLRHDEFLKYLPHAVGDLLWCQEQWSGEHVFRNQKPNDRQDFIADGWPYFRATIHYWADGEPGFGDWEKPRSPVQMPKWASRLTLKVQRVRVERLQGITEADAIACGFEGYYSPAHPDFGVTDGKLPTDEFKEFWNKTHTKPGQQWADNPWVAVYGVEVIKQNVEELERNKND